jgi:hypothetical protein
MTIYLDDIRENPRNTILAQSVNECKRYIIRLEQAKVDIELDIDHDLGDFANDGGDGIELVKWLIETERFYPIKFHTMNPVGLANMQALVNRYWPNDSNS